MPITYTEESTATFPAPLAGGRMNFIDADGDGDMDILYQTGGDGSPFQYAMSNGDGTYTILTLAASPFAGLVFPNHNGGNFHVADIDGDGDQDLWAGLNFTTGNYYRNDGGTFSAQSTATFPVVGAASRILFGDYDNDGDADILYQTAGNGSPFAYAQSNGDGTYTLLTLATSPFAGLILPDHTGSNYYLGDFDGDGDDDVWAAVNNTTGSYFRNDGGGSFSSQSSASFPAPAASGRVAVADFDSDGDYDMLYQTGANGSPWQYAQSNGDGTFTILSQAASPFAGVTLLDHNGSNILAEDVDGDGDHDLIITPNGGTGEFYMAGFKPPALVSTSPADEDTGVDTNPTITLTFDESVVQGSGNIYIVRASDNTVVETIDVTGGQVSGSGTTWTIDPANVLSGLTGYYILIDSGTFVDVDGSIFAGISNPTTFNFTTEPATPPTFANLNGDVVGFTEAGPAVQLDAAGNATITDAEQTNFNGGVLTASITGGGVAAEDVLQILNQGTGAGQIGVSGSDVTYEGVIIGTFTGGTGGADLVVTLDPDATLPATQALVRALEYNNTNLTTAATTARTVEITLSDGLGATSAVQTVTVNVADSDPSPGNDIIFGTNHEDTLNGYGGNDIIFGFNDDDTLSGGTGCDILWGGNSNDILDGGADNDLLYGDNGDDILIGGSGDDVIAGGNGKDRITGGAGKDTLSGGNGGDTFVFDPATLRYSGMGQTVQKDTILDFSRSGGDKIDLSSIDAIPGGADNAFVFVASFTGASGQATLSYSSGNTILRLDVDGDGQADHEVLIVGTTLTAAHNVWIL